MKRRAAVRRILAAAACLVLSLAGCVNLGKGTPRGPNLYVLTPVDQTAKGSPSSGELSIAVGPVEMPAHLNRPQMVTREGKNQLAVAQFDQWAEPLADSVPGVLIENLSALLGTNRVFPYARRIPIQSDFQVAVQIIRMDAVLGGNAELDARWVILSGDGKNLLTTRRSYITESLDGATYGAVASAESRALASLSREIASEIKKLR